MILSWLKKPVIHLFSLCWNEEYMLKYFFKYYDKFVDRYVFFDDGSTDQTLAILKKHPKVEVRSFLRIANIDSYILAQQNLFNQCWKESRNAADWVIIADVDEFLYIPKIKSYLNHCTKMGVTALPALGFQMISTELPSSTSNLPELIKRGAPWRRMNKLNIFNPNKITEINYQVGRHTAEPIGEVKYPQEDKLLLLHYKYLSFEYTFKRHTELHKRRGSIDLENKWGIQYSWTQEELRNHWDEFEKKSVADVLSPKYNANLEHSPLNERWWRKASKI